MLNEIDGGAWNFDETLDCASCCCASPSFGLFDSFLKESFEKEVGIPKEGMDGGGLNA